MRERLALIKLAPKRILDAGCGDGADLQEFQQIYDDVHLLGVDASAVMLDTASRRQKSAASVADRLLSKWLPGNLGANWNPGASLMSGDFSALPLAASSVDLVWSNLALHWHPQPDRVFAEWRRILRVDGLLMFSCFGPDTFLELRAAFADAGQKDNVLSFVDMHDFGDMLVNSGFSTPVMDMEKITVTYESVDKLMSDVRAWGGNPLSTRSRGLMGRQAWSGLKRALEQNRRADGRMPLTYEIIYGHAFRPIPRKTASGESIIRLDLHKK